MPDDPDWYQQQSEASSARPRRPDPTPTGAPEPVLRGSVSGQVLASSEGSVQGQKESTPVVTVRLERNDPHAGRTLVASVRLRGPDALGFAHVGDWIEVAGPTRSAYVEARRSVNHTTGAHYRAPRRGSHPIKRVAGIIGLVLFVFFAAFILNGITSFFTEDNRPVVDTCVFDEGCDP